MSEHSACSSCGTLLHDRTNTNVEHARYLCARCLPPEERVLIAWARDAAIFLYVLNVAGNTDPKQQSAIAFLLDRASAIGLDGGELLWERQHVFDSVSSAVSSPRLDNSGAANKAAPSLEAA